MAKRKVHGTQALADESASAGAADEDLKRLARAGKFDEAWRAAFLAHCAGSVAATTALDDLALPLEALVVHAVPAAEKQAGRARKKPGAPSELVFDADGALYATENVHEVRIDEASGSRDDLGNLVLQTSQKAPAPGGGLVALGTLWGAGWSLALLDSSKGKVRDPIAEDFDEIQSVVLTGTPGIVGAADADGARVFALDAAGKPTTKEPLWTITLRDASFDRSGAVVARDGNKVVLHSPSGKVRATVNGAPFGLASKKPEGESFPGDSTLARRSRRSKLVGQVHAAGSRAVVVGREVALVSADGAIVGRAPLPHGPRALPVLRVVAPSPSGRHVALAFVPLFPDELALAPEGAGMRLELLDLIAGSSRTIAFESEDRRARIISAAWSPSGRQLAVSLSDGQLFVARADERR